MYGVKLIHETQHFLFLFVSTLALISSCRSLPRTDYPILPGHHFMFTWNAPTELCNIHFGMPLDLSTALFPSIYLELVLKDSQKARLFVRHRIQEAMRVSTLPQSTYSIPIYAYIRPVYKDSVDDYVSEVRHHCSTQSVILP